MIEHDITPTQPEIYNIHISPAEQMGLGLVKWSDSWQAIFRLWETGLLWAWSTYSFSEGWNAVFVPVALINKKIGNVAFRAAVLILSCHRIIESFSLVYQCNTNKINLLYGLSIIYVFLIIIIMPVSKCIMIFVCVWIIVKMTRSPLQMVSESGSPRETVSAGSRWCTSTLPKEKKKHLSI